MNKLFCGLIFALVCTVSAAHGASWYEPPGGAAAHVEDNDRILIEQGGVSRTATRGQIVGSGRVVVPESFRAVGSGTSHTLGSLGINYGQAQSYWPLSFAAGKFNSGNYASKENDWLALCEAVLACGNGGRLYLAQFYYIAEPLNIDKPLTIEGASKWNSGIIAASTYFVAIKIIPYRGSGTYPDYAGGFEGGSHTHLTNFHVKRAVKDWPNSQSSVGVQVGDGGSGGYNYGVTVDNLVVENFGVGIRSTEMAHSHISQNNIYDFGVAGIMTAADSTNLDASVYAPGMGDNGIFDNYVMGDSQLHIRNYSTYQGTALETAFGGVARRPLSTKTAASYDIALKNQVAAYWHKYGGGNKFISNKAHVTLNGFKIDFIDGVYLTANATEFMIFRSIWMPLNVTNTIFGQQDKSVISSNELSFARPKTDYSYFGITPTGITIDGTNAANGVANIDISGNVFPSLGQEQNSDQSITGIYFKGNASTKFGGVSIGYNTAHGLNVGVRVDAEILPVNCDILYNLVNNDDLVSPSIHGFTDRVDPNGCLTDTVVSAAGDETEIQFAGASGNLDSSSTFKYDKTTSDFQITRDSDDASGPQYAMRKSKNGGAIIADSNVFTGLGYGHDGTGYQLVGRYDMRSTEAFDGTHHGMNHRWRGINSGSTSLHEQMRLVNDKLGIGLPLTGFTFTADPAYTLDIAGATSGGVANVTSVRFSGDGSTQTTAATATPPGGSTNHVQVKSSGGAFYGDDNFQYNYSTHGVAVGTSSNTGLSIFAPASYGGGRNAFFDFVPGSHAAFGDTSVGSPPSSGVIRVIGDINITGNFLKNDVPLSGTGTVTSVTSANSDISVATTTTTPVLTLNSAVGGGANLIFKADANGRLGVGTTSPLRPLDIYGTTTNTAQTYIRDFQTSAAGGGGQYFLHNNTTAGVNSADRLGYIGFGFLSTTNTVQLSALIESYAEGAGDDTHKGGEIRISTTPSGSNTRAERFRFTDYGTARFTPMAQPSSGVEGDCYWDSTSHKITCCTVAGTPGTWVAAW